MTNLHLPKLTPTTLVDGLGRHISYLRLSVTDRCDFRCVYCMAEDMTFLPRNEVLSADELYRLADVFVTAGINKIRITGGEPLIRPGIVDLCARISALPGLQELVLTTNGSHLSTLAAPLAAAGVSRINVSLDSLKADRFQAITRHGKLDHVLAGLDAAKTTGFNKVKINTVVLAGRNEDEVVDLVRYAIKQGFDISFIEEMPLGDVGRARAENFYASSQIRADLAQHFRLEESDYQSGGPARYVALTDHPQTRIGFISPHSNNFCGSCNRLRMTANGRLLMCLGHEGSVDFRSLLHQHPNDSRPVLNALHQALQHKPKQHEFVVDELQVVRFMNATGG
ncbi:MAG: GTP 3',8-cyclase MoaA [Moraxellaceae bacterium]|nr:GTP 3',8-cyclase MoaA [Moraxellaceae bacterium]